MLVLIVNELLLLLVICSKKFDKVGGTYLLQKIWGIFKKLINLNNNLFIIIMYVMENIDCMILDLVF